MKMEEETVIYVLALLVIVHTLVGLASVASMVSFCFNKNIPYVDFLAFLSVISFLLCNKCLSIDFYEFCKGDLTPEEIPDFAKDNYLRKKIHNFNGTQSTDYTHLRLDKINNLEPLMDCDDPELYKLFFNRKVQYIVFNSIMALMLSVKYNKKEYFPLFMIWVFMTFPA